MPHSVVKVTAMLRTTDDWSRRVTIKLLAAVEKHNIGTPAMFFDVWVPKQNTSAHSRFIIVNTLNTHYRSRSVSVDNRKKRQKTYYDRQAQATDVAGWTDG